MWSRHVRARFVIAALMVGLLLWAGPLSAAPTSIYLPMTMLGRTPPTETPPAVWRQIAGPSGVALLAVSMAGPNHVYAVGTGGTVLRSTDNGLAFSAVNAGTTADLYGVRFVSESTGVIAGNGGTIRRTTDGGATWTAARSNTGANLGYIWFANAQTGWVGGDGGAILRTDDGGANWTRQNTGFDRDVTGIFCLDVNQCWASGSADAGGGMLATTNGGTSWQRVGGAFAFQPLAAVWFLTPQLGFTGGDPTAATGQSNMYRTTDGGATWARTSTDIAGPAITGLVCITATRCWASADERIVLESTDAGATWQTVVPQLKTLGVNRWFHAIDARASGVAVAVGAVYPADGSFTPLDSIIFRRG
jgi:photosystem II stability/assembly factor-like uncharacterized protein